MRAALVLIDLWIARLLRWGLVVSILGCLILLAIGVFGRMVVTFNFSGYHEIVEVLFAWGTYLGTTMLWRERALLRIDFIVLALPAPLAWCLTLAIELGMLVFALLMIWYGWDFATGIVELTPFLQANKVWWYLSIPVCGALMSAYSLSFILALLRHPFGPAPKAGPQQEIA